jgi:long-chain-fatty-acid--CoA ligase ACSBG
MALFDNDEKFSFSFYLAKKLVLNKIYSNLGLNECKSFHSGAAPITKETLEFFIRLGIPLTETYGMSESCGPHSVGTIYSNRLVSVGPIDQYNRSKVIDKDQDGSGELCLYGRHIFMGYLNEEAKTAETFDQDGWLKTGDISKIDSDGYIFITGRLKELLITAGGYLLLIIIFIYIFTLKFLYLKK